MLAQGAWSASSRSLRAAEAREQGAFPAEVGRSHSRLAEWRCISKLDAVAEPWPRREILRGAAQITP